MGDGSFVDNPKVPPPKFNGSIFFFNDRGTGSAGVPNALWILLLVSFGVWIDLHDFFSLCKRGRAAPDTTVPGLEHGDPWLAFLGGNSEQGKKGYRRRRLEARRLTTSIT